MIQDRYNAMFKRLDDDNAGAFVPFVMLGDPNFNASLSLIKTMIDNGADALELGLPYSDPIADGPTIQRAAIRALADDITPQRCFELITNIRAYAPDIPIGLLIYSNLVLASGIEHFYQQAQQSGVDSVLIADIPQREAQRFVDVARAHHIHQVMIAPPNASEETIKGIAKLSSGYTYLLGRAGVTGAETKANIAIPDIVKRLTEYQVAPPIIGFGISTPEQVKNAIEAGAAGAIAGSATVALIEQHQHDLTALNDALSDYVTSMKAATIKT